MSSKVLRYLVTGADGFIGRAIRKTLVEHGHQVVPLEDDFVLDHPNWQNNLAKLFANNKFAGVFHAGAEADTLCTDVNHMMLLNYQFTVTLTDVCVEAGVKIVYSSSAACYGIDNQPTNLYGWSKLCAENYITASGVGVSLRYFNVFGEGEWTKGSMASVAYQAHLWYYKDKRANPFKLFPGKPKRDFIYLTDVVLANLHAMLYVLCSTAWDVGTGEATTFEQVLDILGVPYQYTDPDQIPEGYQTYTCADPKKFMPDWLPPYSSVERFLQYKEILQCKK